MGEGEELAIFLFQVFIFAQFVCMSRRALALAVTFSVRRYRNKATFGLSVQVWLLTSVLLTLDCV